jgi:hypothetical protein
MIGCSSGFVARMKTEQHINLKLLVKCKVSLTGINWQLMHWKTAKARMSRLQFKAMLIVFIYIKGVIMIEGVP